jgi:hypothetical protein
MREFLLATFELGYLAAAGEIFDRGNWYGLPPDLKMQMIS